MKMPTQNVLNQIVISQNGLTATYKIGDIIDGYYDSTTGKFYEESTHTTEIQGASGFLYVDLGNNDIYIYKTSTSSFVKVSGSGGTADNIKFGYLNPSDGKFYEDDSYTVEIPADATKIYIDLAEDTIYRYDATETEYVSIGGGGGGGTTYTAGFGININSEDEISTTDFVGTQDEWNALSAAQKAAYDVINITDDVTSISYKPGHSISDGTTEKTQRDGLVFDGFSVTDDSTNEVTKIAEIPYTAGDGITITNKEVAVSDDISRTWTGTQSQWDAIVDKSPYDGWIINITDDAGAGVGPVVDVVEDGNMNAVSSNAVYDGLALKANLTQISNPNLLDNPWFTVNQRGQSSYTISGDETRNCVDRWIIYADTGLTTQLDITNNGIDLTLPVNAQSASMYQYSDIQEIYGKTITGSLELSDGTIISGTGLVPSGRTSNWQLIIPYVEASNGVKFRMLLTPNTSTYSNKNFRVDVNCPHDGQAYGIRAIKLEVGSISTLAMDVAPNYASELLKCQRYFVRFGQGTVFLGFVHNATTMYGALPTPVRMRTTSPTMTKNGTILINWTGHAGSSGEALDTFTLYGSSSNIYSFGATIASSSLTAGQCAEVNISTNGYIDLSAEL